MSYKKVILSVAKKVPVAKTVVKYRAGYKSSLNHQQEIANLNDTISKLEARNNEWAAEVRELRGENQQMQIIWPVLKADLLAADLKKARPKPHVKKSKGPLVLNWVIPPMGKGDGGHTDIFRTIQYLESKGHTCRIYFYDALERSSMEEITANLQNYPSVKSELFYNTPEFADADAIFATNWYTAYPVFSDNSGAKKYYYVQDFEPYFEPVGTYSTLAENTYKFGFQGLTLGRWLADKLSKSYGMECDYFELGTEQKEYKLTNTKQRNKILFYARPVTPRRGFELGILTLETFHHKHPDVEIHMLGWDVSRYDIPFPYVNHGILAKDELNKLYNQCTAGLVLSFTNMSLLPLEMMAAGCIPVVNDAEHTRSVSYAKELALADPTPQALADALSDLVTAKDALARAKKAAKFTTNYQWNESNAKIESILTRQLIG